MIYRSLIQFFMAVLLFTSSLADAEDNFVVYTVNYPLQYFAQRIAGEQAEVILPMPADIDPAFWQPDAKDIARLQQADIILLNGADYAKWLSRVSLPRRKLVNTSTSFSDRYIKITEGVTHSHGREGDHSHAGTAFTTWLDFTQAIEQARAIAEVFSHLRPGSKDVFERNLVMLEKELLNLDIQVRDIIALDPDRALVASHPVYQYLKRRYGLNLESVMWEPGEVASEAGWSELALMLKKSSATWMLWESEPNAENIAKLQSMGVESLVFNPCGNRPVTGDFLSVMQQNLRELKRSYTQRTSK